MNFRQIVLGALSFLLLMNCAAPVNENYAEEASDPQFIHQSTKKITDVIVHDIFSPPVASRIYAYSSIAAYEALQQGYPEYQSLAGQLNGLESLPQP
ncbi:MAG: phosphatidic acid phosphatase, partial [Bacteroidota bacterium]